MLNIVLSSPRIDKCSMGRENIRVRDAAKTHGAGCLFWIFLLDDDCCQATSIGNQFRRQAWIVLFSKVLRLKRYK